MNTLPRLLMVVGISVGLLSSACGDEVSLGDHNARSLTDDASHPDWVVNGRRFVWVRKAEAVARPAEEIVFVPPNAAPTPPPTPEELANALRPKILKDGNVYTSSEPDVARALALLANPVQAQTNPSGAPSASGMGNIEVRQSAYIIGNDQRVRPGCTRLNYPHSTKGHYSTGCSATMIGPHTAAIAAHCVYDNGFFPKGTFTPAADTGDIPSCPTTAPFGSFVVDWIGVPGGWNHNEWQYDYAIMEFGFNLGNTTGWVGTTAPPTTGSINSTFEGYPHEDKPWQQMWGQNGSTACTTGYIPPQNCFSSRLHHTFDIKIGASGGGFIRTSDTRLYGIQSTQNYDFFGGYWNEASTWTAIVQSFFMSWGTWP
jgi:V8-like Glu-specific endopeptidase